MYDCECRELDALDSMLVIVIVHTVTMLSSVLRHGMCNDVHYKESFEVIGKEYR